MKKRIRMFLPVLVTLAMVISLVSMAIPVMASQITVTKSVTEPLATNIYYVGDTIHYEMSVKNPVANPATNNLTRIWDTLPDGSVVEFLYSGSPHGTYLIQQPGNETFFYANYTVVLADIEWLSGPGYYGVQNTFEADGIDSERDDVYGLTQKNSRVIRPEISIEKTVDFDDDGVYTDLETNVAGQNASWNVTVCNTGYDPVYNIVVTDTNTHDFGAVFNLTVGECKTFIYDEEISAAKVNNATAEGIDDLGNPVGPVSDIAEVVVVDARISIAPNGTNPVGTPHTFNVTVEMNDGEGWDPAVGVNVTPSHSGVGGITSSGPYITNGSGMVFVTVNSSVVGTATVHASATVDVGGVLIPVATDGDGAFTVDNEKDWVDARISIVESDTNPVGTPHTFNVTVEMNDGEGWDPAVGVNVTPSHSGVGGITSSGPYITNGSGMVFVTVNSSVVGTATVHASATVNVGGIDILVATDGYGAYVVSNVKTWEGGGDEGCTPGFWKNNAVHWENVAWLPTGYLPGDSFEGIFGVDVTLRGKGKDTIDDPSLLEALSANGGGINALARHAVAALLNICNPSIDYAGAMDEATLIAAVQAAVAAGEDAIQALHTELAEYNEAGCPINQHGEALIPG